jgi:S-DNA-T family DNA segregation ATPase FtsK/SpoIIIE
VTSTLVLLGTSALANGSESHLYVIDGRGDQALNVFDGSPWCGGVVRLHERERVIRLINRVADELSRRIADPVAPRQPIVVLIDGLDAARGSLDDLERVEESDKLEAILTLGPAHDVMVACAIDRVAAVPSGVLARFAQRWVFHLTDPLDAVGLGVASADVPASIPGRIFVTSTGLEAQLMVGRLPLSSRADGAVPAIVECLSAVLQSSDLPAAEQCGDDSLLPIGLRFGDGHVCNLDVPDGEHVLIIGPPRSGRSTALQRIVRAWAEANPDGWWRVVAPRRTLLDGQHRHRSLAAILDDIPPCGRVLIAVDDAELVDDIGGALAALSASRRAGLMIVATGKPDSLRQSYGHWTGVIRRSRLGLVMTASSDLDGDLIGAMLPRTMPISPRPGLVWLVSDGEAVLAQVAVDAGPHPLDAGRSHDVLSNQAEL